MKLSVNFYTTEQQQSQTIEFNPNFQTWLSRSPLFQIGEDQIHTLSLEGQDIEKPVVNLNKEVRSQMLDFLYNAIVSETKELLFQIEDLAIHDELTYRIDKLIAILDCVKNTQYQYLQRK
ncbi:MAG: hypothetical protein SAJ12_19600 [Jaaginema sp. PMC 1079.18]|nr:hypothetical protein [Jaaginema sp. PMC 1080.18]MEC4853193.1 hypothetical protein [Jaaginema sp. PMC 1079.18]MEC4864904.1 hypothetical protein [Jaaginema sp. PMC 1078.18]